MNDGSRDPNLNPWASRSPDAVRVAAVDDGGRLLSSTNRGIWVDIGARGSATSGAAPRVAGAAAVVLAAHPQLTGLQVRAALRRGCVGRPRARPRLALRARRRRRGERGGVAGADLPARRSRAPAGAPGRSAARAPRSSAASSAPTASTPGSVVTLTAAPARGSRFVQVARRLPRDEAVLRRPDVCACDGRRGLREDHAVSSPHAGRGRSGRRLDGRALLRRAAPDRPGRRRSRSSSRRSSAASARYFACMPSKTLLRAPELQHAASRAPGVAASALDVEGDLRLARLGDPDWDDAGQVKWLDDHGRARARRRARRPAGRRRGRRRASSSTTRLVVATGSSPVSPPVEGLDGVEAWTTATRPRPTRCRRA